MEHPTGFEPALDISVHFQLPYSWFVAKGDTDAYYDFMVEYLKLVLQSVKHYCLTNTNWLGRLESNQQPYDSESSALPIAPLPNKLGNPIRIRT